MAEQTTKLRVCVIGAGAAGLCALRHLAADSKFEPIAYEQTAAVGGTWVYKEEMGLDVNGLPIHSSMYRNLKTNLPAKIMNFPDYMTMAPLQPCCITHEEVLNYLRDYAEHFQLFRHIKFNAKVEDVRPMISGNRETWSVRTRNVITQDRMDDVFDAVMVCNGHYSVPYVPVLPGIENFTGTSLHSHSYRKPEGLLGKIVLILGASSSGIDIALDSADYATRVYLSHNHERLSAALPANVIQVVGVVRFEGTHFVLRDESTISADVFIYCTGYHYTFPFLDKSCDISVDKNYVTPLYKHLLNIKHPSMCIVGIPTVVVPFPMFHVQVLYFLSLLKNQVELPSEGNMLEDAKLKTAKKRHAHKLANQQWDYNDSLADAGGFDRLPLFYKNGYKSWGVLRTTDLIRYKNSKFVVSEDGENVQVILPSE